MKRQSTTVAIAVVLFLLVRLFGAALVSAVPPAVGAPIEGAALLLSGLLPACLFLGERPVEASVLGFALPKKSELRYLLLLPLFIVSVSLLASALTYAFELLGYRNELSLPSDPVRLFLFAVLFPAFVEELLCRYLCLAPFVGERPTCAVWISAILFSVLHTSPIQIPYALFAGLFLGALAVLTRSLWVPMLFHFSNNLVSVLFFLLGDGMGARLLESALLALAALSIPLLLYRKDGEGDSVLCSIRRTVLPTASDCRSILRLLLSPLAVPILLCLWLTAVSCFS